MSDNVINIVVDKITPRIEFVFDFIFNQFLQTNYVLHLTNNNNIPNKHVLHYNKNLIPNTLCILAHPILESSDNKNVHFSTTKYQSFNFPFSTCNESLLPFDPFATAFFFLTQYEEQSEYYPTDQHQRFKVEKSNIARFIHFPMVDITCRVLKMKLEEKGFYFPQTNHRYHFTPTFDVDVAFAHRAKSLKRHLLGTTKLALNLKYNDLGDRFKVWMKLKKDPFDIFDLMLEVFDELNMDAIFFALLAKNGKYNNNNSPNSPLYQDLISKISKKQTVFLHSSYHCIEKNELIKDEKQILEKIINSTVKGNRQHFLRFRLPDYWQMLIENEISDDYSQGFYDTWGYRCGTSFSHKAFDIKNNQVLPITIHPFIFMDTALIKQYQNDVVKVHEKMIELISDSKREGTPCIGIWHNYAMPHESLYLDNFVDVLKFAQL